MQSKATSLGQRTGVGGGLGEGGSHRLTLQIQGNEQCNTQELGPDNNLEEGVKRMWKNSDQKEKKLNTKSRSEKYKP
jgi:hypothetical protein